MFLSINQLHFCTEPNSSNGIQGSLERIKFGAENGSGYAAWKLGNWYFSGRAGEVDLKKAFDWYLCGITHGSSMCMRTAAKMVFNGSATGVELSQANEWLTKAAADGDQFAILELANSLIYGRGITRDIDRAQELFEKAAMLGNIEAKIAIAMYEATGLILNLSRGDALITIRRFMSTGDENGAAHYAEAMLMYSYVAQYPSSLSLILSKFTVAVERGHARAAFELGKLLLREDLGIKNTERAYILFSYAASKGFPPAMMELASMIFDGSATIRDKDLAIQWVRAASDAGFPDADYCLYNLSKKGLIKDSHGLTILTKAAFGGCGDARDHLAEYLYQYITDIDLCGRTAEQIFEWSTANGCSYVGYFAAWHYKVNVNDEKSRGMRLSWLECGRDDNYDYCTYMLAKELIEVALGTKEISEATAILYDAADRGSKEAQSLLGYKLLDGHKIISNKHEAAKYLALAADAGDRSAMHNYGLMLVKGNGVEVDIRRGNELLDQAAKLRNDESFDEDTRTTITHRNEILNKVEEKRGPAKVLEFKKTGDV